MKLKKILGLLIILVALFGMTGCDDILEIWFEDEFAGKIGNAGGDNGIGVWVEIVIPSGETVNDPQIAARVEEILPRGGTDFVEGFTTENFIWPNWDWDGEGNLILTGYVELYGIPAGTSEEPKEFRVIVWLERTGGEEGSNGYPDFDEPAIDAEYQRADGNRDTIFRFPSNIGSWVEADANLFYFAGGGEPMNYDFDAFGDFVLDTIDVVTVQQYSVIPWNPDLTNSYDSVTWRIVGRDDWSWQAEGFVTDNAGTWPAFDIDMAGIPAGDYWIEFEVFFYESNWFEYKKLPLRIMDEANAGTFYDLHVSIWGVAGDPWFLEDSETYTIWYSFLDAIGPTGFDGTLYETPDSWGDFELDFNGIAYNASGGVDGLDWLELTIDMNGDDIVGPEDLRLLTPVALSDAESDLSPPSTSIWFEGWDLRPVFAPPIE